MGGGVFLAFLRKEQANEPTIWNSSGRQILILTATLLHEVNIDTENLVIPPLASGLARARVRAALVTKGTGAGAAQGPSVPHKALGERQRCCVAALRRGARRPGTAFSDLCGPG